MKVFISHSFKDEELASTLKKVLEEKDIQAYMAQRVKEYELLISDKIRKEIDASDYVVAIVTKHTRESASVNQELGYAQGKGVPRIAMIENEAKVGVLLHGMDSEAFTMEGFDQACVNVRNYLIEKGFRLKSKGITSDEFFDSRSMKDISSLGFGNNISSTKLYNSVENFIPSKPMVLFSISPKFLLEGIKITSPEFKDWLFQYDTIEIKNHKTVLLPSHTPEVRLGSTTYYNDVGGKITKYLELQENGFIEQGFTNPLIYGVHEGEFKHPILHICWTTGAFWAFVTFCKKYYDHINYTGELEIRLSISNSDKLTLIGFGGTIKAEKWAEPFHSFWWNRPIPRTDYPHIMLKKGILSKDILSETFIEALVHDFSDKIANAYGLEFAMCYNEDDSFNFEMFSHYT